jgi:orotate phosphoribosyltransferase
MYATRISISVERKKGNFIWISDKISSYYIQINTDILHNLCRIVLRKEFIELRRLQNLKHDGGSKTECVVNESETAFELNVVMSCNKIF